MEVAVAVWLSLNSVTDHISTVERLCIVGRYAMPANESLPSEVRPQTACSLGSDLGMLQRRTSHSSEVGHHQWRRGISRTSCADWSLDLGTRAVLNFLAGYLSQLDAYLVTVPEFSRTQRLVGSARAHCADVAVPIHRTNTLNFVL
jgi:hypothetical protein